MLRIGVDTGGTFTDFILVRDGALVTLKVPSTPKHPEEAVLAGVSELLGEGVAEVEVVHGTTVGTNALLERTGARTALLTTEGFEDVLEIGRQNRPGLYQLTASRPKPLVPRSLRFGVRERVTASGEVLIPLDRERVREVRARLAELGVESIAICYLFAFLEPKHERETAELLADLGVPISLSHEILPEFREYERTSTTVINAYLAPLMSQYISRLEEGLALLGEGRASRRFLLRIMQSNGGSISARAAAQQPVRTVLSGPAGGVVGAFAIAQHVGLSKIITFDMGGTSTDVSLVEGAIQTTHEARIAELPIGIPVIDIHTVGAGGGSIARVDEGGALRVGPESAGADPGPVCYGRGEALTVTDAHLLLGRLDPDRFLGGAMPLDRRNARKYSIVRSRSNIFGRSGDTSRVQLPRSRSPWASSTSPTPTWRERSRSSPSSAVMIPVISPSSPSAAPEDCMRAISPTCFRSPACSFRNIPDCSRRSASCSRMC